MRKVAPDIAANWPTYRDLDATLAGMEQRRGNVSEVWAWLGSSSSPLDDLGRFLRVKAEPGTTSALAGSAAGRLGAAETSRSRPLQAVTV
jgi:hypothetical protein